MDVDDFWMRSSASTSNTLVLSTINSHTFCPPPGALAIDDSDDGLGETQGSYREGTGSMSSWFGIDPSRLPVTHC